MPTDLRSRGHKNAYDASIEPVKEIHNRIIKGSPNDKPGTDGQSNVPNHLPDHLGTLMSNTSKIINRRE